MRNRVCAAAVILSTQPVALRGYQVGIPPKSMRPWLSNSEPDSIPLTVWSKVCLIRMIYPYNNTVFLRSTTLLIILPLHPWVVICYSEAISDSVAQRFERTPQVIIVEWTRSQPNEPDNTR